MVVADTKRLQRLVTRHHAEGRVSGGRVPRQPDAGGGGAAEDVRVALPCPDLPELIIEACNSLINHTSHLAQESNAALEAQVHSLQRDLSTTRARLEDELAREQSAHARQQRARRRHRRRMLYAHCPTA